MPQISRPARPLAETFKIATFPPIHLAVATLHTAHLPNFHLAAFPNAGKVDACSALI